MADTNFVVHGGVDHRRAVVRRRPTAARLLCIVCLFMFGWFLLMAPLFLAR